MWWSKVRHKKVGFENENIKKQNRIKKESPSNNTVKYKIKTLKG